MTEMLTNWGLSWVANHHQFLLGIAAGWAVAHVPLMVSFAFNQAMRVPYLRGLVLKNPEQIKAWIKEIEDTLEKEINEEVAGAKPEEKAEPKA